nr:potassium transporter TrkG [Pseudenhygromyxa sp. WMMC2535]
MVAPVILALVDGQLRSASAYGASVLGCLLTAALLRRLGRGKPGVLEALPGGSGDQDSREEEPLHRKDAIGVVVLIWCVMGIFGALPFMLEGALLDPAAAIFEAVSGFTTTGATVIGDIEGLSRATNLWRCEMHWVGGMGIVVLFVAVFPQLGVGAKQLFRNEVPGPTSEGLRPRIRQTAKALWWIYAGLTALCAALMFAFGMPLFDAICHSMSTLGTGGYSPRGASIGHYQSPVLDWITSAFMLIAGVNFGLYYAAVSGRWRALFENPELRFYLAVNALVTLVVAWSIWDRHPDVIESLRYASFQVLAVTTTTGFMTEDFDTYPNVARYLLFLCMFMGGCAGSTAGGIKVLRVFLLFKIAARELRSLAAPNVVELIKLGPSAIPRSVVTGVLVFFAAYMLIFSATSLLLVALDMELMSAMSATVACLSSVGPGLDAVGPTQNFDVVPAAGKLALCFCMIAGRLEIFVLLSIFSRELWRR